jgi:hypothetical protein
MKIFSLVLLALLLVGSNDDKPRNVTLQATPGFTVQYPPNLRGLNGESFAFPQQGSSINYVTKQAPRLQVGQTITLTFELQGDGTLHPTEGGSPEARIVCTCSAAATI